MPDGALQQNNVRLLMAFRRRSHTFATDHNDKSLRSFSVLVFPQKILRNL
jgi:hypothetical protein